jgi:hypothetical protein
MIRCFKRCSWLAFFIVFVSLSAAYAQNVAALSDEQAKERLSFVANALYSAQPRAQTWWYGWIAGYSAGAIVSGSLAKAHWNDVKIEEGRKVRDRDFAEDMLVGSATFALGVGGLLIDPFLPAYGPKKLRAMPENTPEERLTKLQKAEELLRQCAQREKEGKGWLTHMLNLGVNAAAGLVTAVGFHRPWYDGLITFAAGETVSLFNIFTQPRQAIRDLNNYEVRYLGRQGVSIAELSERKWVFNIYPGGFSVAMRF